MECGKTRVTKAKIRDISGFIGSGCDTRTGNGDGDSSPAKLLTIRLEKLERDLQLLTGIQTLLMKEDPQTQNGFNFGRLLPTSNFTPDVPERDSSHHSSNSNGSGSKVGSNNKNYSQSNNVKIPRNSNSHSRHGHGDDLVNQNQDGRDVTNSNYNLNPNSNNCKIYTTASASRLQGLVTGSRTLTSNSEVIRKKTGGEIRETVSVPQTMVDKSNEIMKTRLDQDAIQLQCQVDEAESNLELLEALNVERKARIDVEDSARRVAIKLQKIEDDLGRERETKQVLLSGTLQLRNQISSQESHIKECEANIKELKLECGRLKDQMEQTNGEKMVIAKKCKEVIYALRADKKLLECQNKKISLEKADTESQLEETRKNCIQKEQSLQTQDQKNVAKYNQMITKYAQVDKERQNLAMELRATLEKLQMTDTELKETQDTLRKIQAESERDSILKDCILKKLKGDMTQQQQQFESQIQSSQTIIAKTKSIIIQVRKERDDLRQSVKECQEEKVVFQKQTSEATQKYEHISKNYYDLKQNIKRIQTSYENRIEKLGKENSGLKSLVKTLQKEKSARTKLHLAAEKDFLKEKSNYNEIIQTLTSEKEHATAEMGRCTDNFRVLQKVSEDQARTIQSLRGEREEQRKIKFSLETEIRERDANESVLIRKLEQEQRKSGRLEDNLEKCENKLSALEEELRDHNCEDFVESGMQKKLAQIESEVKSKYSEWQESIEDARTQRDKALRDACNTQKEAEDTKSEWESRILDVTTSAKQEYQRLKVESKRVVTEKTTRIMELEGDLEQQKLQSNQMQRSLCGKIQQLQCALNVCIASTTNSAFGNPVVGANPLSNFL